MKLHTKALLFIGLFCILRLVYFKVVVHHAITVNPTFMPDLHVYQNSNDMYSRDAEDELPNVKFGGRNVRNIYVFLIVRS